MSNSTQNEARDDSRAQCSLFHSIGLLKTMSSSLLVSVLGEKQERNRSIHQRVLGKLGNKVKCLSLLLDPLECSKLVCTMNL